MHTGMALINHHRHRQYSSNHSGPCSIALPPVPLLLRSSSVDSNSSSSGGAGGGYYYYTAEHNSSLMHMEKRQLFLRSYRFSRKKSLSQRIKSSLLRFKKLIWLKFRSTRRLRKLVWSRLRHAIISSRRRTRFIRLLNQPHEYHNYSYSLWCR